MDEASYLGLSIPRFLLRLPFGRETEAINAVFEEMAGVPDHEELSRRGSDLRLSCAFGAGLFGRRLGSFALDQSKTLTGFHCMPIRMRLGNP